MPGAERHPDADVMLVLSDSQDMTPDSPMMGGHQ